MSDPARTLAAIERRREESVTDTVESTTRRGRRPRSKVVSAGGGPAPTLRILETRVLRGPNYWAREPVIRMLVDLGVLEDYPSNRLPGFNDALVALLPTLEDHACSLGRRGGFITRLRDGTWTGHIAEHIALEFQNLPGQIENARKQGNADRLKVLEAYQEQLQETVPTPPSLTVADHLTLFRGEREIRILYLGRGHSDTDLMVYLPREKVVATGDFFEGPGTGALAFGFHDEWANNLEKLKALDFETVVPGHGEPFKGKEQISYFQAFLRDLWNQTKTLHDQKVPVAEAAKRIDLTAHRDHYRNINGPGFQEATIARIYQVLDQRGSQ